MKRRRFLFGLTATSAALWAGASIGATFADGVVGQLTKQGFYNIAVETTWLGRVRIVADRADGQREIILNPRTGEVLRDSWKASGASTVTPIIDEVNSNVAGSSDDGDSADGGSSGSGSGGSGSDDSGGDDQGGDDHGNDDHGGANNGEGHSGDNGGNDHGGNSGHGGSDNSHGGGDGGDDDDQGGKGD